MKWSIVGLIVVGVVAAIAAALLVGATGAGGRGGSGTVAVVIAARDIPSAGLVRSEDVMIRKMPRSEAPSGFVADPGRVVGRVLTVPLVKDQVVLNSYIAVEGSAAALASAIPEGMRAVGVSLSDYASLEGALYPGSVVDVLATYRRPAEGGGKDEIVSVTLIKRVSVLAVEGETLVSGQEKQPPSGSSSSRKLLVKLLVTPQQAQQLHLAQEYAKISLALRNPLDAPDEEPADTATLLSDMMGGSRRGRSVVPVAPPTSGPSRPSSWSIELLRGGTWETQAVSMPDGKGD